MKAFLRNFFAGFLALVVFTAICYLVAKSKLEEKPEIKDRSYLIVDIYGEIFEYDPPTGVMGGMFEGKPETLNRILCNLEKAAVDDRIEGVIMKLSASNTAGGAMHQEMRRAIKKVRKAGKPVYAFTDDMDRNTVSLASACDSIFATPTAWVVFTGMSLTSMHVKSMLDKLGINPNIHKIKDYKSAAELVTRTDLSPEAKENLRWLLDEFWDMQLSVISEERGIPIEKIEELMEHAIFMAEEAKEAGLVDRLVYWSDLADQLKREDDEKLRTVSQADYATVDPEELGLKGDKKIAVVHAQGMIGGRKNKVDPLFGVMMGHESVCSELRRARRDKDVAAVIFRVDSGGGEGLASDIIGHEVRILADEKPVVVSMVDVAGSGGYMIAYRATKIVADPLTITGSIGSISGKFNMTAFHRKLGITHDFVTKGPMALLFSQYRDFTEAERERFEKNHWDGFNMWLADVAKYRGMTFEEAEKLAHGRVWTGRQAKANGLIDEVGGLDRAIELAKELAEIPAGEKVTVVHYPKREKSFLSSLLGGGLAASVRWAAYRYLHQDVLETARSLSSGPVYIMDDSWIK
ncbi:MAG: signal peptide peptidase SppA [Candidatus Latescibacteria bacterium]|nr:signal peptide peptidase SppA [Candidatus Latescibacterota bacterium]NIO28432.1 signal peptide peptidase SppA [Candidatus Latescibacterota bacterium]NIO55981.1 signal peptide peptidase SppA [Candidatus Latescibacterota bacterium]NIT01945.1 signal peptide peptidase SppA [Candidatus Latescibacterota bacterium]